MAKLSMYKGDNATIQLQINNYDGTPKDITGFMIRFTVKKNPLQSDNQALLKKSTEYQRLVLDNYTSCVTSDIGKTVKDDTVDIGILIDYDNTYKVWIIDTSSTILDSSVMTIVGGTGHGDANGNSEIQILILDQISNKGKAEIYIYPEDTFNNTSSDYDYDIEVTDTGGKVFTLTKDVFSLLEDVTKGS